MADVFLVLAHRPNELRAFMASHDALLEGESGLTQAGREMIKFALKLARKPESIEAADHESLRDHRFNDDDIWDIGAITGLFALSNRLAHLVSMRPNDEFFTMGRG